MASFSRAGRLVVTGATSGAAAICDATTGKILHFLRDHGHAGHMAEISSVAFSADDKWIVTASRDRTAKIWDSATGDLISTLKNETDVLAAAVSPDGTVVTVDESGKVRTWDWAKGVPSFEWEPIRGIAKAAFSPNGKWLGVIDSGQINSDGTTKIMDTAARGTVLHARKIVNGRATSTAFSPDSEWVVTSEWMLTADYMTATLWRTATGEVQTVLRPVQRFPPLTGAVSPDGALVVTAGFRTQVWGGTTGSPLLTLSDNEAGTAAFDTDGARLVTGGPDGARIWDMKLESRPPADIAALIGERVPWVLEGGQLVRSDPNR
jgi:WD40 repeat protein